MPHQRPSVRIREAASNPVNDAGLTSRRVSVSSLPRARCIVGERWCDSGWRFAEVDGVTGKSSDVALRVRLLGRFSVERSGRIVPGLEAARVQELFAYLLLNGQRPQPREALATLLWAESSSEQGRKYLRQTLW